MTDERPDPTAHRRVDANDEQVAGDEAGEGVRGAWGTLYVVATPIGNLGDITLRALEVLRSVAVVAAEDTRHTRRLWARYEITTPLLSYHAHSDDRRTDELVARLEAGEEVALVSDAGTPLVSDPGEVLVTRWAAAGGRVVAVPGASAVLTALVSSGIPAPRWGFEGFLPRKGRERWNRLARIAADDRATVIFESPGRTTATLRDLAAACGSDRNAAVCRELTKRYEQILRGSLAELMAQVAARPLKGEVSIVVAGAPAGAKAGSTADPTEGSTASPAVTLEEGRALVDALVVGGQRRSAAARDVARTTGLPRRDLFAVEER